MYRYKGRFSRLVELNSKNDTLLFSLLKENNDEYRKLVSDQDLPTTYPEFLDTLKTWFLNGRLYQFLVYPPFGNKPVGTIFFYSLDSQNGSVKMSVFFEKESRGHLVVAESLMIATAFVRRVIGVKDILFSVYLENDSMLKIARRIIPNDEHLICNSTVNNHRKVAIYKIQSSVMGSILTKLAKLHR